LGFSSSGGNVPNITKWLNSRDKSQETRVKNDEKAVKKEATKKETPFAAKAKEGNK
jgi:hypothetical protein